MLRKWWIRLIVRLNVFRFSKKFDLIKQSKIRRQTTIKLTILVIIRIKILLISNEVENSEFDTYQVTMQNTVTILH